MTLRILSSLSAFSVTLAIAGTLMLASGAPAAETSATAEAVEATPPATGRQRAAQVAVTMSPSAVPATTRPTVAVLSSVVPAAATASLVGPVDVFALSDADRAASVGGLNARGTTVWIPGVLG